MASGRPSPSSTALVAYSMTPRARLNWNASIVIDPTYIAALKNKIADNFPKDSDYLRRLNGGYPDEDLKTLISNWDANLQYSKNYNPLGLSIIKALTPYSFYAERSVVKNNEARYAERLIGQSEAAVKYLNFLKQYNLAYINFLEAINGSDEALRLWKEKFTTEKMFRDINLNMKVFEKKYYSTQSFLYAILVMQCFHILFSKDKELTTVARARAFELLVEHTDLDVLSKGFKDYADKNYDLCCHPSEKLKVYNLIPREFVTESFETGEQPHNDLFFKNKTIKKIFKIGEEYPFPEKTNLASAISDIVTHYQKHAIQIIHSALRCAKQSERGVFEYLLMALLKLSKLDNIQKEIIFDDNASYRHGGESVMNTTAQIDWVMGFSSFGDYLDENELDQLDREQMKIRIRQQAYRIYQLEAAALYADKDRILNTLNERNDPNHYFRRLLMPADEMPEDEFIDRLRRNYRVLAHERHPDSQTGTGSVSAFQELQQAYGVLFNREQRMKYLSQTIRDGMASLTR